MTQLQERAMLATLSISRWTARRYDKKVSREVDDQHGAQNGGRFNKILIDPAHTKALQASANTIRENHYRMTLPWDDEGPRLLPAKLYMKYVDVMRGLRTQDERLCEAFFALYPQLVTAAKNRLGSLYDPSEYPTPGEVRAKFNIRISMTAVPSASDFRVSVSEEAAKEIRTSIAAESAAKFEAAMKDCYRRLHEVVERIHSTLTKEDPRIFDTLMTNARDLVNCLPDLNLTEDSKLEELRSDLGKILVSPDALRANKQLHKGIADEAAAILEKMKGYV